MQPRANLPEPMSLGIRVWPEATGPDTFEWRGRVRRLDNQESLYFRDVDSLMSFLREILEEDRTRGLEQ